MAVVYTGGTFDLFHAGHALFLRRCRALAGPGGRVVVSLNTDDFVESYKGQPPTIPYVEREEVLLACRYVDEVVPNIGGADSKPAVEIVRPDLVVIGDDWAPGNGKDYMAQMGFDDVWMSHTGFDIVYLPPGWAQRSSAIREAIMEPAHDRRESDRWVERCPIEADCPWDGSGDTTSHIYINHRDVLEPDPKAAGLLFTRGVNRAWRAR